MSAFLALLSRDLRLALRSGGDVAAVLAFFVITVVLFPLGVGPELALLGRIAAGVVWVAALLATLLALDRLFAQDYEDGSLDLLMLSPLPLEAVVLAKALAHWLLTGLPLILLSPLMAAMLGLQAGAWPVLALSLLLGTPCLSLIGAVGSALTLGARRGGALLALLILPLFVPVLIFGAAAVEAVATGLTPRPHLLLLGGCLAAALPLAPIAAAAALRQAQS
ncbi:heme exporter protein CcmB [Inquilinus sp. NPDC058860]|uniref:heme exporter protein CcmB n=1 Tax=Inquilinus sp. NPDC058860 TaxID=3346652 RepID=UPI0036C23AA5